MVHQSRNAVFKVSWISSIYLEHFRHYFKYFQFRTYKTMAMSKKILEKKEKDRKEKIAELEKMAASGSGEAKKKLAKEKRKLK